MKHVINPWRVLIKGIGLYFVFEIILAFSNLNPGFISIYKLPFLSRERFPFSTAPHSQDSALDVGIIDTIFEAHIISRPKSENEYRLIILGDSAVWGDPLPSDETLASQINKLNLTCNNKNIVAYNLGYPLPSAIKDIMILDKAKQYNPDQILWEVTLQTLLTKQVDEHPILGLNPTSLEGLNLSYHILRGKPKTLSLDERLREKNIALYRSLRFQTYGIIQFITGIDQIQEENSSFDRTLSSDLTYQEIQPPTLDAKEINFQLIKIFEVVAGDTPVTLINEPILQIKDVPNSDIRYNAYYPRWVYDQYRNYLSQATEENHWSYLDYWDKFSVEYFANTPLHLNRHGEKLLAQMLSQTILKNCH
ncbi:MAG: hypothetical protein U0Z26_18055 [Anaerolineales bacterium]